MSERAKWAPRPDGEDELKLAGQDDEGFGVYWCGNACREPHRLMVMIPAPPEEVDW